MTDMPRNELPCWIDNIEPADASHELAEMYLQVSAVHNKIHNLYRDFSLQPVPLVSANQHYRDVLHNESNHFAPLLLELLASQEAIITGCHYALTDHGANLKSLLRNAERGDEMLDVVRRD